MIPESVCKIVMSVCRWTLDEQTNIATGKPLDKTRKTLKTKNFVTLRK